MASEVLDGIITCTEVLGILTMVLVGALEVLFMEVLGIPTMAITDLVGNHNTAFLIITTIVIW
ncbi:MAG TPA: hypothetical protein DCR46_01695 [Cytophagales bacterium]|nr:hypothetical protein [Cytophagales bacterium]